MDRDSVSPPPPAPESTPTPAEDRREIVRRLTERLERVERDLSFPNVRPRDAATLILIDRSGPAPRILFGRRHERHKFLPGKFVFPGGRVEPADRRIPAASALDPLTVERLCAAMQRPSPAKARGYALTALRETCEETGLLIGRGGIDWPKVPHPHWGAFAAARVMPDLDLLQLVARAITPPGRSRRFDTRFFAADAESVAFRIEDVVGPESELVELVWLPIADADTLDLPPITKAVLAELDLRIAEGFTPDLPVPFYRWSRGRFVRVEL